MVKLIPAASNVPPLFMPTASTPSPEEQACTVRANHLAAPARKVHDVTRVVADVVEVAVGGRHDIDLPWLRRRDVVVGAPLHRSTHTHLSPGDRTPPCPSRVMRSRDIPFSSVQPGMTSCPLVASRSSHRASCPMVVSGP